MSPVDASADRSALEHCDWLHRFERREAWLRGENYDAVKRVVDVVIVLVTSVLILPVLLACALALKLESPGASVLFPQRRTGFGGRRFTIYKFRTMVPNAEELKRQLAHLNQRTWPDFKIENDPRITRVGRFLRRTSLDELPQLFNVLRGDMSLVGPRPTSLDVSGYDRWQMERFEVRPGLTGLWQVVGRSSESFVERLRLDIAYVDRRSLSLDLAILARTVPTVLLRRGSV